MKQYITLVITLILIPITSCNPLSEQDKMDAVLHNYVTALNTEEYQQARQYITSGTLQNFNLSFPVDVTASVQVDDVARRLQAITMTILTTSINPNTMQIEYELTMLRHDVAVDLVNDFHDIDTGVDFLKFLRKRRK